MSDRANPAADILPRSVWEPTGPFIVPLIVRSTRIAVLSTAGGYVRYRRGDEPAQVVHHATFRRWFRPLYDRRAVRSQFTMSLANLGEFRVFWLPDLRRMVARSVACSRHFRIPEGAVPVGTYSSPFTADQFLDDLDCVLATLDHEARSAAAAR